MVIAGVPYRIQTVKRDNNSFHATDAYIYTGEQALAHDDMAWFMKKQEEFSTIPTVEPVVTKDEVEISF